MSTPSATGTWWNCSDRVIAVYDGREKGGTVNTIRLTHNMKKELREIPVGEIHIPKL